MNRVEIVEVAPRDGLQNIPVIAATQTKVELIRRLAAAGFRRMEIGSFVSPRHVPQMADMAEVAQALGELPGLARMALVPNGQGARRAVAAGIRHLLFVVSMSDAHNMSNVRRPTSASLDELAGLVEEFAETGIEWRVGLGTSFHCPFTGLVEEDVVLGHVERIRRIDPAIECGLSDTTGMATPDHVGRLAARCIAAFGHEGWSFHGHDTAGFGIANVMAAYTAGVRSFDGAAAGLGGCPFAPGATGNIATEDLVHLFTRMGVETGIDLEMLLDAADFAAGIDGAAPSGHTRAIPQKVLASLVPSAGNRGTCAENHHREACMHGRP